MGTPIIWRYKRVPSTDVYSGTFEHLQGFVDFENLRMPDVVAMLSSLLAKYDTDSVIVARILPKSDYTRESREMFFPLPSSVVEQIKTDPVAAANEYFAPIIVKSEE